MSVADVLRRFGLLDREYERKRAAICLRRDQLRLLSDEALKTKARELRAAPELIETFALTALIAERTLGLRLFDVQLLGALALQRGHIAEMQTGEGKTLAAVPAIVWYALHGDGVHVFTANDYLARRDALWMGDIYRWFGLSVAHISQTASPDRRRAAYRCDVVYATANEVGFDYLRDGLARNEDELVQRRFAAVVIDEADSILIDEARIPLVIAGGVPDSSSLAYRVDAVVRSLRYGDYCVDGFARNVQLTDSGIRSVESALACGNLFQEQNLALLTAVQDSLHAHVLLRSDVDYIIRQGAVELVDEFKGRVAQDRRWPAGLQSAIEAKERLQLRTQGRILGSITVQSLVAQYPRRCGMTGTAATQREDFWKIYRLPVTVIPTNLPVIRRDLPDILYHDKEARDNALVTEIARVHQTGRPILIGTGSIRESEALSRRLQHARIAHSVLNARNHESEAQIVAQAGALGAVTVSTNMAGRGTDILLGGNPPVDREKVLALGGLYVLGTTRHEARRIDHQLRGRAGRQGDPGASRFFISLEDDLLVRFGIINNPDVDSVQRTAESQNLEIRETLWKYDCVTEHHRQEVWDLRRDVLLSPAWTVSSLLPESLYTELAAIVGRDAVEAAGRSLVPGIIDDLWSDYLANVAELKGGIHWVSWGGRDPLYEFLKSLQNIYSSFYRYLKDEVVTSFRAAAIRDGEISFAGTARFERGATWTYLTTDQPFGPLGERIMRGLLRKAARRLR